MSTNVRKQLVKQKVDELVRYAVSPGKKDPERDQEYEAWSDNPENFEYFQEAINRHTRFE